jgi:predicted RNA-binding protein with PUA-like domain
MAYWLFKTEPDVFGIQDLKAQKKAVWDGVRNYAARNFLRDEVAKGDTVFLYHSSCPEPGVAGLATVSKAGFPDPSAFDKKHKYFDPKSDPAAPRWFSVEVAFQAQAKELVPLAWMREDAVTRGLECFRLNRLSISHVSPPQAARLLQAAGLSKTGAR